MLVKAVKIALGTLSIVTQLWAFRSVRKKRDPTESEIWLDA